MMALDDATLRRLEEFASRGDAGRTPYYELLSARSRKREGGAPRAIARRLRCRFPLVLLAPLLACKPAANAPAPGGDVIIGGHTYRLPDEAFADGLVDHGPQDSLLLEIPVPVKPNGQRVPVQLLLLSPAVPESLSLEDRVKLYVQQSAHVFASFSIDHKETPFTPQAGRVADAPSDLVQVVWYAPKSVDDKDVFVRPPLSAAPEAVQCDRPGSSSLLPRCQQIFGGLGYGIKASYSRDYLGQHQVIHDYVLKYLRDHMVTG